jgi:hypothetical protein
MENPYNLPLNSLNCKNYNVSYLLRNTHIYTCNGYLSIQYIKVGTLIPTLSSGNKKVVNIGIKTYKISTDMIHPSLKIYKYNCGLRVTGKQSVLVDCLTEEQQDEVITLFGDLKQVDGKFLLPAYIDQEASELPLTGIISVYHLVLENEDDDATYGILSHGKWIETCSKNVFDKYSIK